MTRPLRILELFSGTGVLSEVARSRGHQAFTVDLFEPADLNADVLDLSASDLLDAAGWDAVDMVWASPICTGFSVASIGRSWRKEGDVYTPISDTARLSLALLNKTVELIKDLNPRTWYIENPRGMARRMRSVARLPRATVTFCLAGETEVITRNGQRPIKDLVGNHDLLMPDGTWQASPIRKYGRAPMMKMTLRRAGMKHIIRATANHLWFVNASNRTWLSRTDQLRKGDRLPSVFAQAQHDKDMSREAIARGFVFGDGSTSSGVLASGERKLYGARVTIYDEKMEDLPAYFEGIGSTQTERDGNLTIHGLPLEWKTDIPDGADENETLSWLAGYFAADGSVSKNGQVTISSANREHLEAFRDLANTVGIGCYAINTRMRSGFGSALTPLHSLGLIRTNLTQNFFIRQKHRERHFKPSFVPHWRVVSVEPDEGGEQDMYCAEVAGHEAFVLAGNILTHNCQYGETRMKPTDIWHHSPAWTPRPACKNGDPCHVAAPRGSRTGTQGIKGAKERGRLPTQLCEEVIIAAERSPSHANAEIVIAPPSDQPTLFADKRKKDNMTATEERAKMLQAAIDRWALAEFNLIEGAPEALSRKREADGYSSPWMLAERELEAEMEEAENELRDLATPVA